MNYPDIQKIIAISERAAHAIMAVYREPNIEVSHKLDFSVLTRADIESHHIISDALKKEWPEIPVISEESSDYHDYEARKNLESFFLVDPLDGTKEFVNRNDEFTVNIAYVYHNKPILGVINVPALNRIYYALKNGGAFLLSDNKTIQLPCVSKQNTHTMTVVVSRSHACRQTEDFLNGLKNEKTEVVTLAAGSALKFGLVAEGRADIYPRFSPTMEWDTAAGQILVEEAGKKMITVAGEEFSYNKKSLKNGGFVVKGVSDT